ncbi:hypothetical protein GGR54DRAFT_328284 [Hypoxylon sp. NC1633]|nr:hypothetical protein GGR54DRAFT_328284 [Hypoxylon sp. NC1633]
MESKTEQASNKPVHILDCPNEVLMKIFADVAGAPCDNDFRTTRTVKSEDGGPKEISNTRLVCKRFHDQSSHLLLPVVTVSMNPSSLARLDEISRHPWIAPGVRSIRVILESYPPNVASELSDTFLSYYADQLVDNVKASLVPWRARFRSGTPEVRPSPAFSLELAILKERYLATSAINELVASSRSMDQDVFSGDKGLSNNAKRQLRFVQSALEQCGAAYGEQEKVRANGTFARAIAAAMAKLKVPPRLFITDYDNSNQFKAPFWSRENAKLFVKSIAQPMNWAKAEKAGFQISGIEQLVEIPLAIHQAGVKLEDVYINVPLMRSSHRLYKSEQDLKDLAAFAQNLHSFTFQPSDDENFHRYGDKDITRYLRAFMGDYTEAEPDNSD